MIIDGGDEAEQHLQELDFKADAVDDVDYDAENPTEVIDDDNSCDPRAPGATEGVVGRCRCGRGVLAGGAEIGGDQHQGDAMNATAQST